MSDAHPIILVDFSAIAWACWHSAEAAETAGKEALQKHADACPVWAEMVRTGHDVTDCCKDLPKQYDPHEVLKTNLRLKMQTIEENTGCIPTTFVMVKDSHPKWKYETYPDYKANRDRAKHDPRAEAEAFLRQLHPTMSWVLAPGHEADDAIAALAYFYNECHEDNRRPVVIVSGDADLFQLLRPGVKIFRPTTKKFVTVEDIQKKFHGLGPRHIRAAKSLWGDSSDNLPNCAPRQQRQLVPLIQEAEGDILKMIALTDGRVGETCLVHLRKNIDQIIVNWRLVGLNSAVTLEWQ